MKLRIRGNSVRFRVTKSELDAIAAAGSAEDSVHFAPGAGLRYRIEVKPAGDVAASLDGSTVKVALPRAAVERWLADDEVSIRAEQSLGEGQVLKILVEKDFVCLAPRSDEDDTDLFANPQKSAASE
jgi:hypothetical protein